MSASRHISVNSLFHFTHPIKEVSVAIVNFPEPETAPFTGGWREPVAPVQLNVLHRVAQAHSLHSTTSNNIATHLDNRHLVDQLLRIRHMRRSRQL